MGKQRYDIGVNISTKRKVINLCAMYMTKDSIYIKEIIKGCMGKSQMRTPEFT